jgi:hypothetical protein
MTAMAADASLRDIARRLCRRLPRVNRLNHERTPGKTVAALRIRWV